MPLRFGNRAVRAEESDTGSIASRAYRCPVPRAPQDVAVVLAGVRRLAAFSIGLSARSSMLLAHRDRRRCQKFNLCRASVRKNLYLIRVAKKGMFSDVLNLVAADGPSGAQRLAGQLRPEPLPARIQDPA